MAEVGVDQGFKKRRTKQVIQRPMFLHKYSENIDGVSKLKETKGQVKVMLVHGHGCPIWRLEKERGSQLEKVRCNSKSMKEVT